MISTRSSTPAGVHVCEAGFVQRREWMLYKIKEDHYPLNIGVDFAVEAFDPLLFQRVLDALVERHEILRTTLRAVEGRLEQVIHAPADFPVKYAFFDLRGRKAGEQEAFVKARKMVQASLPFNFEYGPLFRVAVFARGAAQFEINLVFHHLVFDQYSAEIFKRDAVRIWQAGGAWTDPAAGRAQYRTYTAFENSLLRTRLGDAHREYWQAQLAGGVPRLAIIDKNKWDAYYAAHARKVSEVRRKIVTLPAYDPGFVSSVTRRYQPAQGGAMDYAYREETLRNIRAFKQKSNSSLHALFIAGFVICLNKLSGQELFGFDIPASRRVDGDHKNIIGWLAAGGVCFFDINRYRSADDFLAYIDRQLYFLSRHCVYPFEVLGCDAQVPVGSAMPVLFTLSEAGGDKSYPPGARQAGVVSHQGEGETACQDMDLYVTVFDNACVAHIRYNSFLIPSALVEKVMAEQEFHVNRLMRDVLTPQAVPA